MLVSNHDEMAIDEERYRVSGRTAVASLLQGLLHGRQAISVQFGERRESLLTTLLSVRSDGLVFDLGVDAATNYRLLAAERLFFSCRPDGIQVRFLCGVPKRVAWGEGVAAWVPLPENVLRLQRRDLFRVMTPVSKPVTLKVSAPGVGEFSPILHDLSVGGGGLTFSDVVLPFNVGDVVPEVAVNIDHKGIIYIDLDVRHVTRLEFSQQKANVRVGVRFRAIPQRHEATLQKWILTIDQERRKFEQG